MRRTGPGVGLTAGWPSLCARAPPPAEIGTEFRTLGYDPSLDHGAVPRIALPQQATEPSVLTPQAR